MYCANRENQILYLSFNSDNGYFCVGKRDGYAIFETEPLRARIRRNTEVGIQLIEVHLRSNIFALVGDVKSGDWANTKLRIWSEAADAYLADLEFRTPITGVKLRNERVVVATDTRVFVYSLTDLRLLAALDTAQNIRGTVFLQPIPKHSIVAVPSRKLGSIDLYKIPDAQPQNFQPGPPPVLQPQLSWHACSDLRQMTFDNSGHLVAAVSTTGTVIHLFEVTGYSKAEVYGSELRRGSEPVDVMSVAFNYDSSLIALSSSKKTIHIFVVQSNQPRGFLKSWVIDLGDRAVATVTVPEVSSICAFIGQTNNLAVLGSSGTLHTISIAQDPKTNAFSTDLKSVSFLNEDEK